MKVMDLHGKKRSIPGTILYCMAILLKIVGITICYMLISENGYFLWFIGGGGMELDFEDQGIGTIYFGSIVMALQMGILLYSLTHDNYLLSSKDRRPWMKSLIFLWTPIHALFVWFRDYGRSIMSWEYAALVIVDLLIFIGLLSKTGRSWANRLRPFKDQRKKSHGHEGWVDDEHDDDECDGDHHHHQQQQHGMEQSGHHQDIEKGRHCAHLPTCPVHGEGDHRDNQHGDYKESIQFSKPSRHHAMQQDDNPSYNYTHDSSNQQSINSVNPKIRVDGLSE